MQEKIEKIKAINALDWFYKNICAQKCYGRDIKRIDCYEKMRKIISGFEDYPVTYGQFIYSMRVKNKVCDLANEELKAKENNEKNNKQERLREVLREEALQEEFKLREELEALEAWWLAPNKITEMDTAKALNFLDGLSEGSFCLDIFEEIEDIEKQEELTQIDLKLIEHEGEEGFFLEYPEVDDCDQNSELEDYDEDGIYIGPNGDVEV